MAKAKKKTYVYPVDLTGIKDALQKEAYSKDRSLHYWIKKILKTHLANTADGRSF